MLSIAGNLILALTVGYDGGEPRLGQDYVIKVAEMDTDFTLFEVFLPDSEKGRKEVLHQLLDEAGSIVAAQKFGTAGGHYKIAMVASYSSGCEYTLVIDGKYRLNFEHKPRASRPGS